MAKQIAQKVQSGQYSNRREFLDDFTLLQVPC